MTLTYNLNFQSSASYGYDPYTRKKSRTKASSFKKKWKQTDTRTRSIQLSR